jgi:hypothetical protein
VTGGVVAIAALAAAVGQLNEKLGGLHTQLENPASVWMLWAVAAVLLLVGLSLLRQGLSRKSRLLRPEALLIDPDNPSHLHGRDEEIRRLAAAVAARPLVFLEGESGSGKSALVRSGLIPALRAAVPELTLLPIYVNSYTGDWERGLREQLVAAAWRWLGAEVRERLGVATLDDLRGRLLPPGDAQGLLYRIRNELGLIPLLVFDQFDDYQVAHRDGFLREGRWITAEELSAENGLWCDIRAELERRAAHCLFITRRELFAGLEAVRFEQPESQYLQRVKPTYITALLEKLVSTGEDGRAVIGNPSAGWEVLKNRLIQDLTSQGRILPIQARVVFKGLIELPYLSVGAYERKGGIGGLEAAYIEDAVSSAAGTAGIPQDRVLRTLLRLVDESDPEIPKARAAGLDELLEAAGIDRADGGRILDSLEQSGVIRPRVGDGAEDTGDWWSLYHDYLAKAVLAAHRRANRWQRLLTDKLRAFRAAGDWRVRWRALLSPWEQARLIWPTLRGRVRWAGYRGFGLLSGARFLPIAAAMGVAWLGGDWYLDQQAASEADLILTAIRSGAADDSPETEEYRQL